jgi:hypothetical protein
MAYNSIIKFLENLFKFKAETIFNRMNIQDILRIRKLFYQGPARVCHGKTPVDN